MMINVKDVSRLLNISEKKVYRLIATNSVPYNKIGEEFRFNRVETLEWATQQGIKVTEEPFEPGNEEDPADSISFLDALRAGSINYNVKGTDRESVLKSVIQTLKLPKETSPDFLFQILLAREKMGSTGIGEGIAIPHVRNPLILNCTKPVVTLCFLENPIDFNAADKLPVSILFTLISPTIRTHLQLLSRLGLVLQNQEFKAAIIRKTPENTLLQILRNVENSLSN